MPQLGHDIVHRLLQSGAVADVDRDGHAAAIEILDELLSVREILWRAEVVWDRIDVSYPVEQGDVRTFPSQGQCVRPALSPGTASDDCNLSCK
jgi:hypothetical protein